jgi:hypothetical protein
MIMTKEMWFVPYRRLVIKSKLDPPELASRLRSVTVAGHPSFRKLPSHVNFVGKVTGEKFRVVPAIRGRNTYLPWLVGTIQAETTGTVVTVVMTLHPIAIIAVLALLGGGQYLAIVREGGFNVLFLGMILAFHMVMYVVGFRPEARKAEERLRELAA